MIRPRAGQLDFLAEEIALGVLVDADHLPRGVIPVDHVVLLEIDGPVHEVKVIEWSARR